MKVEETFSLRAQDARFGYMVKRYGIWWRIESVTREPRYDGSDRITWRVVSEAGDARDVFTSPAHETWMGRR